MPRALFWTGVVLVTVAVMMMLPAEAAQAAELVTGGIRG